MRPTLSAAFAAAHQQHPDRVAVRWEGGQTTYRRLGALVERLAGRLHERGLTGRRVGILLPNLPVFPLVHQGVVRAGSSALLLNPMNSAREVEEYLAQAAVDTVLTAAPLLGLLPRGTRALLVDALPEALQVAGEEARIPLEGAAAPPEAAASPEAEAALLFTAADRGWARGAVLSHRNLIANLRSTVEAMGIAAEDRVVGALPFIHAFGLTVSFNTPLAVGAAVIPVERFHPLRMLDLFEEQQATVFAGVPAMYGALLSAAERRGVPRHSLRVSLCGGAPLEPEVARRWEEVFGLPLRQGYGLTEAGPVCLFNHVDRPNHVGTLGYPFPGVDVSIRGQAGEALPAGEVGEICVRGDNVFGGYLGEGGRSPHDFHGDWLRTGDLGSEEENGTIRFRGMLKPMFTRNGFNIYPRELERVLSADPRVHSVSVRALPSPARENDIVLFVRPAAGAGLTEDEVRELCRARLAAYKQPTRVEIEGVGE